MKRNTTIDILRLVFALIIMLHHSRYFLGYDRCVFAGGSLAVEFFFIVSGFLMAKKAAGPGSPAAEKEGGDFGTARFLLGKLDAVLPEMLAGWLIGFAVIAAADSLPAASLADKLKEYLWEPLMLRMTGIYTGGFNGVTWYISSMLLCMAVLYPLTRRYPDMMTKVAAPMISLLLLGYLCRNFDHPREPSEWLGFTFKGNIRAMAEISLGIAAYRISARISRIEFRRTGEWLITIAESALYFAYIRYMFLALPGQADYLYILAVWIAVVLTFSGRGAENRLYRRASARQNARRDAGKSALLTAGHAAAPSAGLLCARFSSGIFFGHLYIATRLNRPLPGVAGRGPKLICYVLLSLANGAVICALSALWRRNRPALRRRIKALFVKGSVH